jgi:hypothetical protein
MVTLDSWSADGNQLSLQLPVIENNTLTVITCWSLRHALVVTLCTLTQKTFYVLPTEYAYVLYASRNKQQLFPCKTLTCRFLERRRSVFTVRYESSLQIRISLLLVFDSMVN